MVEEMIDLTEQADLIYRNLLVAGKDGLSREQIIKYFGINNAHGTKSFPTNTMKPLYRNRLIRDSADQYYSRKILSLFERMKIDINLMDPELKEDDPGFNVALILLLGIHDPKYRDINEMYKISEQTIDKEFIEQTNERFYKNQIWKPNDPNTYMDSDENDEEVAIWEFWACVACGMGMIQRV